MSDHHSSIRCTLPGSFVGTAPKKYGRDRRCRCGTKLTPYTKGEWCNPCQDNPDRMRHYSLAPKEITMEPETIKAKQAADTLGVTGKELKQLERDGRIKAHKTGRGLFGSTFLLEDVVALKAELCGLKSVGDGTLVAIGGALDDHEASGCCGKKDELGCGGPDCTVSDRQDGKPEVCNGGGPCEDPEGCSAGRCRILPSEDVDPGPSDPDDEPAEGEPEEDTSIECLCLSVAGVRVPPIGRPCPRAWRPGRRRSGGRADRHERDVRVVVDAQGRGVRTPLQHAPVGRAHRALRR